MKIIPHETKHEPMAEMVSDRVLISSAQDAVDLMAECRFAGYGDIVIYEKNLSPGFYDLKTCVAGDVLQKFSNYRCRLAIIGDFTKYPSAGFQSFIRESNRSGMIVFVPCLKEAITAFNPS